MVQPADPMEQFEQLANMIDNSEEFWIDQETSAKEQGSCTPESLQVITKALKSLCNAVHALEDATRLGFPARYPEVKKSCDSIASFTDELVRSLGLDEDKTLLWDIWSKEYARLYPVVNVDERMSQLKKLKTLPAVKSLVSGPPLSATVGKTVTTKHIPKPSPSTDGTTNPTRHTSKSDPDSSSRLSACQSVLTLQSPSERREASKKLHRLIRELLAVKDNEIDELREDVDRLKVLGLANHEERQHLQYTIDASAPLLRIGIEARMAFINAVKAGKASNPTELEAQTKANFQALLSTLQGHRNGNFIADIACFKLNILNQLDKKEIFWVKEIYGIELSKWEAWTMTTSVRQAEVLSAAATIRLLHRQNLAPEIITDEFRAVFFARVKELLVAYKQQINESTQKQLKESLGRDPDARETDCREFFVQKALAIITFDRSEKTLEWNKNIDKLKEMVENAARDAHAKLLAECSNSMAQQDSKMDGYVKKDDEVL